MEDGRSTLDVDVNGFRVVNGLLVVNAMCVVCKSVVPGISEVSSIGVCTACRGHSFHPLSEIFASDVHNMSEPGSGITPSGPRVPL